jgi:transcriptional regulator with XRE-family HTH domain
MKNENESIKIGHAIRELRQLRGIKVDYLSNKLGYENPQSYLKLERNEKNSLSVDQLFIICDVLEVSLFNFFIFARLENKLFNSNLVSWSCFIRKTTA